jgi:hypothetical protein
MKTEHPGVDWLLNCEPRPAQVEALARSYTGWAYRDRADQDPTPERLDHVGGPARGWGHMMQMRVGKTPTLLNEFLLFRRDHRMKRAFIFAPNKYKNTWALEAQKFGVDEELFVFESSRRKDFERFIRENDRGMVFVNYEATVQDANRKLFAQWINSDTLVGADESIFLKNRESTTFKVAHELSKQAGVTRPMSGKPTTQGVHDLYSQLRFARHIEGWNYYQFRGKFAIMGGFKGKKVTGVKNTEQLHALTRQCYFFAKRGDWATAIDSDYEKTPLAMTEEQAKAYQDMEDEFMVWLENGEIVSTEMVLTKHMKLQQISSGFIIDEFKNVHELVPFEKTPKFMDLLDRLENYTTGKVIIATNFVHTADMLVKHLAQFNPAQIRGSIHMKKAGLDVDEEKHRFNNDSRCRILIGQTKATKYGHTLMGIPEDPCETTIFFENSYSLDDRAQLEERNQGEGQKCAINIVDYISSPVEGNIIEALIRKESVSAVILGYYKGA